MFFPTQWRLSLAAWDQLLFQTSKRRKQSSSHDHQQGFLFFFSLLILFYFTVEGPIIKLYNFDENKNVLALFPTLRKLLTATVRVCDGARFCMCSVKLLLACTSSYQTKLSCLPSLHLLWSQLFLHSALFNSCILNCSFFLYFSLWMWHFVLHIHLRVPLTQLSCFFDFFEGGIKQWLDTRK